MCDVRISIVYKVCTFNLLTLMFRHGLVMLKIKNLLIAGAVEINFVSYDVNKLYKEVFKIAVILNPISQTGYF